MKTLSLLFAVLAFILSSCSTTELLTSDVKSSSVTDIQYFEPLSYVSGDKAHNDSLSCNSKQLISEVLQEFKDKISITGTIVVTNNSIKQRLEKDIENLLMAANDIKVLSISGIRITPLIDSLLESNSKRFGLITLAGGYIRTHSYNAKQKALQATSAIAIGVPLFILTQGSVHSSLFSGSNKVYSSLYVMIVDADQDNIAFYRKSSKNADPTDKNVLRDQLKKIFKGYYF
jgi:predicted small secreted protein